jgi:putative transposase
MSTKPKNLPLFNSDKDLSQYLEQNLTETLKQAIRITVKMMVKEEMTQLRDELDQKLSFNGSYDRNMLSPMGKISNIPIPRFRELPHEQLNLHSTTIFEQEKDRLYQLIAEMHRVGVSHRKVKYLAKTCFGIKLSANKSSEIHRDLAEQESLNINQQALTDEFEYLLLDGVWVTCKTFGLQNTNKTSLLCALGIKADGTRTVIGFTIAYAEDTDSWTAFVTQLKQRGITGKQLKLIICDDNGGLANAIAQIYPTIPKQICITHKMRNVMSKTSHKHKQLMADDLKIVYQATTKAEAMQRIEVFAKNWYVKEEKAVKSLAFNFEYTLTYLNFPQEQWSKLRTTNILEREFREVRCRIKVFDHSFNDSKSLTNYANSIFNYLNNNYPSRLHTKA